MGTGLIPIRNRPGWYARIAWADCEALKPYELFERADGSVIAQNILKKKFPLEKFLQGTGGTWVRVGFQDFG